jgi:flotillin
MELLATESSNLNFILMTTGIIVVVLLAIVGIIAALYTRATKEEAFVRTGMGGQKVVKDGGALVLGLFHDIVKVNMNTLRLDVTRQKEGALITKDRMRVDVKADFYLRVSPDSDGIAMAAQTLGQKTRNVDELRDLIESKFVDVLRSVAAEMTMTEMHEQRSEFVQKVQHKAKADLAKNGLELESVSLTAFDQTAMEYFNEANAFDAEGKAQLEKVIQAKKKETNDIRQTNKIAMEQRDLDAKKESLTIAKEQEQATLTQNLTLETSRQENATAIKQQKEAAKQEQETAEINSSLAIEKATIAKTKSLETAQIEQDRDIEVANQDKDILIAEKSEAQSAALAKAAIADKDRITQEEAGITAQATAQANREKEIAVIEAKSEAEQSTATITVRAAAELQAAEDNASAIETEAKARAKAKTLEADANERHYAVEAEGIRSKNEAENSLSPEQVELQKALARIAILPEVIAQAVAPLENIEGIKILQGYNQSGNGSVAGSTASSGGLAEQITRAGLDYRANAPLVDNMLQEVGLIHQGGSLTDLVTGTNNKVLGTGAGGTTEPLTGDQTAEHAVGELQQMNED